MDNNKTDRIARRAYEIWEKEGRPHGRHDEHWLEAEREGGDTPEAEAGAEAAHPATPYPGMMGDGTEEQNLGQPGSPDARITEDEVQAAFGSEAEAAEK